MLASGLGVAKIKFDSRSLPARVVEPSRPGAQASERAEREVVGHLRLLDDSFVSSLVEVLNRPALRLPLFRDRPAKPGFNPSKHLRARSTQGSGKIHDRSEGWALLTAFQLADIGSMITAFKRQRLLREAPILADIPKDRAKGFFRRYGHRPLSAMLLHAQTDGATICTIVPETIVQISGDQRRFA
jgi:hypothetical protein